METRNDPQQELRDCEEKVEHLEEENEHLREASDAFRRLADRLGSTLQQQRHNGRNEPRRGRRAQTAPHKRSDHDPEPGR